MNTKPKLEIVKDEKIEKGLHEKTMFEITGKTQKLSHLKPPHFPDDTERPVVLSPFKLRMLELFKSKNG